MIDILIWSAVIYVLSSCIIRDVRDIRTWAIRRRWGRDYLAKHYPHLSANSMKRRPNMAVDETADL